MLLGAANIDSSEIVDKKQDTEPGQAKIAWAAKRIDRKDILVGR